MLPLLSLFPLAEVAYGIGIAGVFAITYPAYRAFRHRRSSYGTVFNSVTGKPEALVAIDLRDLHGSIVRSAVTDRQGRYRIVAPKGDSIIEVRKFGFTYPSKLVKGKEYLEFENILNAPHIIVGEQGVMVKNIPIDPSERVQRAFHLPKIYLPKRVSFALFGISPFLALVVAIFVNSIVAWGLFALCVVIFGARFVSFRPASPPYGTITDTESGHPVEGVAVRVLDKQFNKVLETQITSPKGRYAFVVNRGSYRILMKKNGYKTVMLNFNGIVSDGHLLAKDVKMKALADPAAESPDPV